MQQICWTEFQLKTEDREVGMDDLLRFSIVNVSFCDKINAYCVLGNQGYIAFWCTMVQIYCSLMQKGKSFSFFKGLILIFSPSTDGGICFPIEFYTSFIKLQIHYSCLLGFFTCTPRNSGRSKLYCILMHNGSDLLCFVTKGKLFLFFKRLILFFFIRQWRHLTPCWILF